MIAKNCSNAVPEPGDFTEDDTALLTEARALLGRVREQMDVQAFHEALETIWTVVRAANGYVDRQAPWVLRKTDPARMATVLYTLAETVRHLAILLQPVMPESMARMLDQLAVAEDGRGFEALDADHALAPGTPLPKPQGIFPRYVEAEEQGS